MSNHMLWNAQTKAIINILTFINVYCYYYYYISDTILSVFFHFRTHSRHVVLREVVDRETVDREVVDREVEE